MSSGTPSLLEYLDAPILVGDPDGRTVYVNPAFEASFEVRSDEVRGQPLAALFEGGAREAILRAVVDVCGGGQNAHFQLREEGAGFSAIASPISAAAGRVGVIILLMAQRAADERVLGCARSIASPLDELTRSLALLSEGEPLRGARGAALESAAAAVDDLRKNADDLIVLLSR